jgi:hypothetical protein
MIANDSKTGLSVRGKCSCILAPTNEFELNPSQGESHGGQLKMTPWILDVGLVAPHDPSLDRLDILA